MYEGSCSTYFVIPCSGSVIGTTNSLRFEVDGHNPLRIKRALDKVLERLVSLATLVIILHVLHASELGLGDKGISLRPSILIGGANNHGEDIGFAVLEQIIRYVQIEIRLEATHLLLRGIELVVLVQKLGLLILARQLEHGDSVHAVGHLDGRDLSKRSGYGFDMLRDSCGVWWDTAGRKGESSTDKPRIHI